MFVMTFSMLCIVMHRLVQGPSIKFVLDTFDPCLKLMIGIILLYILLECGV